jgi:putative membrane protein
VTTSPSAVPYCGTAPLPGALIERFNLDPLLIMVLIGLAAWQFFVYRKQATRFYAPAGWLIAAAAFLSPLCALSVALFSARIAQHMVLILVSAPLIALSFPKVRSQSYWPLWGSTTAFLLALWIWHMPVPYASTFSSVSLYWCMHVSLFGSAILLWRELLHHDSRQTVAALAAGTVTFVQMGLLGAVLSFADHPLFIWHLGTTRAWGLSPLEDQQLGGILMWVPGTALFLWTAIRSMSLLWRSLERARPA